MYSQPHLIGTWLIGSSGSDQDFTPDNHCYDRQVACLSVITMAYQVRNLDHFLNSQLTRFRLSGVDCICFHLPYLINTLTAETYLIRGQFSGGNICLKNITKKLLKILLCFNGRSGLSIQISLPMTSILQRQQ